MKEKVQKAVVVMIAVFFALLSDPYQGASSTLWLATAVPGTVDAGPDNAVELGVGFRSDASGTITGIRFYKADTNTGTHVANLWSSSGVLLASATFSNETASGWQQVNFPTPVSITANTIYVASYHTSSGHYSFDDNYFATDLNNAPLHAPANGVSGINGVFAYGATSSFPNQGWHSANYWVDPVFISSGSDPPPTPGASSTFWPETAVPGTVDAGPDNAVELGVGFRSDTSGTITGVRFYKAANNTGTHVANLWSSSGALLASAPFANETASGWQQVNFSTPVSITANTVYVVSYHTSSGHYSFDSNYFATGLDKAPLHVPAAGGSGANGVFAYGATSSFPNQGWNSANYWVTPVFAASGSDPTPPTVLTGNPILIICSDSNPFSSYYAEILRAEGFTSFTVRDLSQMTSTLLASFDVVILGEVPLTASQVTTLSDWVTAGGRLVAMRPDKKLASLLGLVDRGSNITDGYLRVNTSTAPGNGIVDETIQYHGSADLYALNSASGLATLYSSASEATSSPAASFNRVGNSGGQAAAFTYDLARSVVYTRQGNPVWSNQERDGFAPIRSDDLYFGAAAFDRKSDWVDLDKVAIPQADEQQRLLANLIIQMTLDRRPLPRFWYFPRNLAAVVVMTGDDHGYGGTVARFNAYKSLSPANCSVANWECIRGTSYIYTSTPLTNAQASGFNTAGFELGLHLLTNCADYTHPLLDSQYSSQLAAWRAKYTSLSSPATNRTHCIAWSDYTTQATVESNYGIRMDTNFYYWPGSWVNDRPGLFTGSGMPMRFADMDGNLIDVYQAATQMTDESGQSFPFTIDTLLDRALGSEGYYGAFVVNAHTDIDDSEVSDAVISSAVARGIPVISSRQLLTWVDGRNASTFTAVSLSGNSLTFSLTAATGATGLVAMVPVAEQQTVTSITRDGSSIPFTMTRIKGVQYASFSGVNGSYQVRYNTNTSVASPTVTGVTPVSGATGVGTSTQVSATFSSAMDPTTITSGNFELRSGANALVSASVAYDAATRTATLRPTAALGEVTSYTATVKGGSTGVKDAAGNQLSGNFSWSFSTAAKTSGQTSLWPDTALPGMLDSGPDSAVELGVRFRSDVSGYLTGIRFYKSTANTGTHVGNLWSSTGSLLASATFTNESASGWQQATFPTPVIISANTEYVASYHASAGHYSIDQNFFAGKGVDNAPLHALADGPSSLNGVFAYGPQSAFPNQAWSGSNYWVDVLFTTDALTFNALQSQMFRAQSLEVKAATLVSIKVTPAGQRMSIGTEQKFTATGTFSDGSAKVITGQAAWTSSDPNIININSAGVATARGSGRITISATLNGITGSTTMTATDGMANVADPKLNFTENKANTAL